MLVSMSSSERETDARLRGKVAKDAKKANVEEADYMVSEDEKTKKMMMMMMMMEAMSPRTARRRKR